MIRLAGHPVGAGEPLLIIAGPDVIESAEHALRHARLLLDITRAHGLPFIFKCSFDKANRTSGKAFRGPGLVEGLRVLAQVKREVGVPILTDVHETAQVAAVAEVVDVLQVPAFLCRQTDLVVAVARSGRGVNLKKGQFVAPLDMLQAARKATEAGNPNVLITERGASFGYHNLVVDMRGLHQMRSRRPGGVLRRHPFRPATLRPGHRFWRRASAGSGACSGGSRRRGGCALLRGAREPGHGTLRRALLAHPGPV